MSIEDRIAHYRLRVAQEERAARRAACEEAARAHARLASLYRQVERHLARSRDGAASIKGGTRLPPGDAPAPSASQHLRVVR